MAVAEGLEGRSSLAIRSLSAVVMLLLISLVLWLGGFWFDIFVAIIAIICLKEFITIGILGFRDLWPRVAVISMGIIYLSLATYAIVSLPNSVFASLLVIVVATDVGAYFSGRTFGGPKIAPHISPSKTWAGLVGGFIAAGLISTNIFFWFNSGSSSIIMTTIAFGVGGVLAIVAQAGDFFESWLKRRAGLKDSSNLIPGHGGVFDRVDGLLPVAIIGSALWSIHPS